MAPPPYVRRRHMRLEGYDYARAGAYYVTIDTHQMQIMFGEIIHGIMILNDAGRIAEKIWLEIEEHFPQVVLDEHIIMPNHLHGILWIIQDRYGSRIRDLRRKTISASDGKRDLVKLAIIERGIPEISADRSTMRVFGKPEAGSLSTIIGAYKGSVSREIRRRVDDPDLRIWKGRFHDHIIRNNADLERIRRYIRNNPVRWCLERGSSD